MSEINAIVAITGEPYVCVVTPEALLSKKGDSVRFQNLTSKVVILAFEKEIAPKVDRLEIPANSDVDVPISAAAGGYPYSAVCEETMGVTDKARRPRIIICRPIT